MEQGQGSREGVGATECCVSPEIHLWWQPCGQEHGHGVGSNFLSTISRGDICARHCGGIAGPFCRILFSRDVLMMNQPVNVEECNQHVLDTGLHLPRFLRSRRWCRVPLGGHLLCFRVIPVNPAFFTSDYRGHRTANSTITIPITPYQHHALIFVVMNVQVPLHDRQLSMKGVKRLHSAGCYINTAILKICSGIWGRQKKSKGLMHNETEGKFNIVQAFYHAIHKPSFSHLPQHPAPPLLQIN